MESIGVELFDDVIVGELKSLLYRPTHTRTGGAGGPVV